MNAETIAMREVGRSELRSPAMVLDIDVANPSGDVIDVERFATAWCLVRENGVVVAARFFDLDGQSTLALAALRDQIVASGLPRGCGSTEASDDALTVIIPTNRGHMVPTVLKSLAAQSDAEFDVLIVDNSADGHVVRNVTDLHGLSVSFCHEPRPGLSRARNAALLQVTSDLIAWIDDDEEADRDWVAWIKRGFASPSRPDAVVGVMVPAELETEAQVNFERYGGFNKGRGMQPVELRAGTASVWDPLYPLPSFGAGGNMAFRTETLRAIGGFDNRLGSPAIRGGEETRALSELLARGSTILHWPPAVTWHYHRRTDAELEKQFFGYSAGLTGFYASAILTSPTNVFRIARLIPRGVRQVWGNRRAGPPDGPPIIFPEGLLRAGRRGLYRGGWMYLREAYRQRRSDA